MKYKLKSPTNELVRKYNLKFKKDKRYFLADKAITNLFKFFSRNKKLEDVLLKISVINDLYSTNIFATYRMAECIVSLNIDKELQNGNPNLVNKISSGHKICRKENTKSINFYSFATKYCSWHNKNEYPIYDSFVEKILKAYRNNDKFSKFKNADLKDYIKFKTIIFDFKNYYNLSKSSLKEIDKFLWMYGKEKFPKNYKKRVKQ